MRRYLHAIALVGIASLAVGIVPSIASAASSPLTGTVSCGVSATSTFTPWLNYSPSTIPGFPNQGAERGGKHLKWRLDGHLSGCTGAQTGGNPRVPGPIRSGEIVVKGKAVGRQCASLSANGLTVSSVKITWFDAAGNRMPTTKGTGTATVAGLFNGSPFQSLNPPVVWPSYVPPGIITFTVSATGKATSRAFPGRPLTVTAVSDRDIEWMDEQPCSFTAAPAEVGIPGFSFYGTNAPSSLAVS